LALNLDPLYILNLVLCIIILVIGYLKYAKRNKLPLYIGLAFGLFGISHLVTILGFRVELNVLLIIVRTLAYLTVIYALYTVSRKK